MSQIVSLVGEVASVDDVPEGGSLADDHAAGATALTLVDASGFAEGGGSVDVDGQVLAYTVADLDTDTLTLAVPLPAALPAGHPVHVSPVAVSRVATVVVDGQPVSALVPQSLLDQVPTGLREDVAAETVTVRIVDGRWTVVDLVAVPSRAVDREQVEQIAIGIANGKTQHSMRIVDAAPAPLPAAPTTDGRVVGDTHHDLTSGTGVVRAAYILTGDGWEPHSFGDEVVDSVAAGKILGGVITALLRLEAAGELVVGSEDDIHVRIHEGRIDVMRPGEAGEPAQPYISMGRGSDGAFRVLDADDGVLGGIMPDGSFEGPAARVDTLEVAGQDLGDVIGPRVLSLGSDRTPARVEYGPYSVDMSLWECTVDVPAGYTLSLDARGWMRASAGSVSLLRCSYTVAPAGTTPPRPMGSDTELLPYAPIAHATGSFMPVTWSWDLGAGADVRVRLLVWFGRSSGGGPSARDFVFTPTLAQARGASGFSGVVRATPGSSSTPPSPPPPLVTRTRRYDLGPHSIWVGSTRSTFGYRLGDVQAGRSSSGQLNDTAILMPSAARGFIAESEEIVSVRVRLAQSVYPTTIRPSFGTVQTTNITGTRSGLSPRNIHPGSRTYTPSSPSGWTTLDASTLAALKAGDPGLWIPNLGSGQPVGRFHGPSAGSSVRPQIEITTRSRT